MEPISLSRILAHWADIDPDAPAITHEGRTLTFAELEASSNNRLARAYEALGVRENDFVTIALPNGIEFFEATFATWKLGATPQPVSAKLPAFERDQIVELGRPSLVVGVPEGEQTPVGKALPVGYQPDASLGTEALPEKTAASFKAMTSGGSTGRPKLIVAANPAAWDPEADWLQFSLRGGVLIPDRSITTVRSPGP